MMLLLSCIILSSFLMINDVSSVNLWNDNNFDEFSSHYYSHPYVSSLSSSQQQLSPPPSSYHPLFTSSYPYGNQFIVSPTASLPSTSSSSDSLYDDPKKRSPGGPPDMSDYDTSESNRDPLYEYPLSSSSSSSSTAGEFGKNTKKDKILLEEIIHGVFSPRTFNGTFLSDTELLFRDSYGNLVIKTLETSQSSVSPSSSSIPLVRSQRLTSDTSILVPNTTFVSIVTCS